MSKSSRRRKRQRSKREQPQKHEIVTASLARAECACGHKVRVEDLRNDLGRWKTDEELAQETKARFDAHVDMAREQERRKK